MEKSNNKKLLIITMLMGFAFLTLTLFAQDKKDDLKSRMEQLNGKVEKITVKVIITIRATTRIKIRIELK